MLYLDVVQDEGRAALLSLSQALRLHFAEAGFPCTDDRPCTPHLTIAKRLQRPVSDQLKQKQWPPLSEEVREVCVQCNTSVVLPLWGQGARLLRFFVVDGRLQCCVQGSSLTDIDGGVAVVDTVQLCAMQVCALESTTCARCMLSAV